MIDIDIHVDRQMSNMYVYQHIMYVYMYSATLRVRIYIACHRHSQLKVVASEARANMTGKGNLEVFL
jgi:hypothetical protein